MNRPRATAIATALSLATAGIAAAGIPASARTVAQVARTSVIVARGPNGCLNFYYQPVGAKQWHGPEMINCALL
jgi:hypothetical protein